MLAKRMLHFWLLQASLVQPLTENVKLRLTSDMAQLEFSLNQLLVKHGLTLDELTGEYKALRAFRY
jgi:hypothetical protein